MQDRLRTVEWAREQLGLKSVDSARRWLRKHGIQRIGGRFRESHFWRVWDQAGEETRDLVRRAFS